MNDYDGREPLNPKLYQILKQRFGRVIIANEGERSAARRSRGSEAAAVACESSRRANITG
jgi:hypothetical protein